MFPSALHHAGPLAIDLNGSSNPLHWSFIDISVANLIVICVMVVIFGAALLIRFPHSAGSDLPPSERGRRPGDRRGSSGGRRCRHVDGQGADEGREAAAAEEAAAGPPARLRGLLDLRFRRGRAGRARHRDRLRVRARTGRLGLVAHQRDRPLLQQRPPVVGGAVHGVPGHPPVGQVLDGRLARPPRADLDYRRGRVHGLGGHGVHRLPVAAELRLTVDRQQRQGRVQRGRHRLHLERDELRPDVHVAHRADAARPGRHHRRRTSCWCGSAASVTRCPSGPSAAGRRARRPRHADAGPWRGPTQALRHHQGRCRRDRGRRCPDSGHGRRALLSQRAAGDHADLGEGLAGRPRLHLGHRAERHRGSGRLRPAVQQRDRRRSAGRAGELAEAGRNHPAGECREGLRAHPAVHPGQDDPGAGDRPQHLQRGIACPAEQVGDRIRQRDAARR